MINLPKTKLKLNKSRTLPALSFSSFRQHEVHRLTGDRTPRRRNHPLSPPKQPLHARWNLRLALLPRPRQIRRPLDPHSTQHHQPLHPTPQLPIQTRHRTRLRLRRRRHGSLPSRTHRHHPNRYPSRYARTQEESQIE